MVDSRGASRTRFFLPCLLAIHTRFLQVDLAWEKRVGLTRANYKRRLAELEGARVALQLLDQPASQLGMAGA